MFKTSSSDIVVFNIVYNSAVSIPLHASLCFNVDFSHDGVQECILIH